jgi:Secretion system C-terminal sorting domain
MKQMYLPLCAILCALLSTPTAQAQCGLSATGTASTSGNNTGIGSLAWQNTGATTALDGSYADAPSLVSIGLFPVTTVTNYLTLNGFGFNIPNTYTICGIGLSISKGYEALATLNGNVTDRVVQLATINSPTSLTLQGSNQASGTTWSYGGITTVNYGGNGNLMGATGLTYSNVNNSNFGVAISANVVTNGLGLLITANIDKVSMSIYTNPVVTLPITLENFAVTGDAAGNTIRWTASANDIANQFVVQRSGDGNTWQNIATFTAATGTESYSYTDTSPLGGPNYYRLELLNTDGTTGYSITAIISSKSTVPGIHFYPNPFHDMINITASGTFTRLSLKDIAGRTFWVKEFPGGINSTQIPAGDLPPGLYFITVDGTTYKIIKN